MTYNPNKEPEKSFLKKRMKQYRAVLVILLGLFVFRVVAQLIQKFSPLSVLPPFDDWQSGTLPFGWLVILQVIVIILCLRGLRPFWKETLDPVRGKGKVLLFIGVVYFLFMLFRLMMGTFVYPEHSFWGAWIPTVFHLDLALFILVLGQFNFKYGEKAN